MALVLFRRIRPITDLEPAIIQEAEQNGIAETKRKRNSSHSLYRKWHNAYNEEGMHGLKAKYKTVDPAFRQPEMENARLKSIVAK